MVIYAAFQASSLPRGFAAGDAVHPVAVDHYRELHVIEHAVVIGGAAAFQKVEVLRDRLTDHDIGFLAEFSQGKAKSRGGSQGVAVHVHMWEYQDAVKVLHYCCYAFDRIVQISPRYCMSEYRVSNLCAVRNPAMNRA